MKKRGLFTFFLAAAIILTSCSTSTPPSGDQGNGSTPPTENLTDGGKWTMIEGGAGGAFIDVGVGPTGILAAAADLSGIYLSYDNGKSWHNRGAVEGLTYHTHFSAVGFDAEDENIIYAGAEGALYKSYDKGYTFHPLLSKDWDNSAKTGTFEVVLDPANARGYKDPKNTGSAKMYFNAIIFSQSNPNIGYASAHTKYDTLDPVILKTTDRGETWKPVKTYLNVPVAQGFVFNEDKRVQKIVIDHKNPEIVYFVSQVEGFTRDKGQFNLGPQNAIYKSTDGGVTWNMLHGGTDHTVTFTANRILAKYDENGQHVIDPEKNSPVMYSRGETVTEPVLMRYILDFELDPVDPNIMYATKGNRSERGKVPGEGTYKSIDGGATWTKIDDKFGVLKVKAVENDASKTIVRRIDIGGWDSTPNFDLRQYPQLWESQDAGATWTLKSDHKQFTFGGIDPQFYSTAENYLKTVDGNPKQPDLYIWGDSQWVYMSDDGGASFRTAASTITERDGQKWYSAAGVSNVVSFTLKISEADPNFIMQGNADIGLWRSLDNGKSWQHSNQQGFLSAWIRYGGQAQAIALDPERANVAWVGLGGYYSDQLMARSEDYGALGSWENVHNGLPKEQRKSSYQPGAALRGLSVDRTSPKDNRTLFVVADDKIFRSVDDGYNWAEMFDMTGGSPFNYNEMKGGTNDPDRTAYTVVDPKDGKIVYAGGANGMFRSTKGGDAGSWEKFGPSWLSNVQKIVVSKQNSDHIYVAAYGDGLYFSSDKGANWKQILKDPFLRGFDVNPQDERIIIAGSANVFKAGGYVASRGVLLSVDGGQTWTEANQGLSWKIVRDVEFNPKDPNQVFIVTPGTSYHVRTFDFNAFGLKKK